MNYTIECEQEDDGRWLAEVLEPPGVLTYGTTQDEAILKAPRVRIVVALPFQRMIRSRTAKTNAKNKTFPGIQRTSTKQSQSARKSHARRLG